MKKDEDRDDSRIVELFSSTRRAEEVSAPSFRTVLRRERPRRFASRRLSTGEKSDARARRPLVRPAFVATAASLAVAAMALWTGLRQPLVDAIVPVDVASRQGPVRARPDAEASGKPFTSVDDPATTGIQPTELPPPEQPRAAVRSEDDTRLPSLRAPGEVRAEGVETETTPPPVADLDLPAIRPEPSSQTESNSVKPGAPTRTPSVQTGFGGAHVPKLAEARERYQKLLAMTPGLLAGADASREGSEIALVAAAPAAASPPGREDLARRARGSWFRVVGGVAAEEPTVDPGFNTESYALIRENGFLTVQENPLSTFSIDVDTASYTNVRRFLDQNRLPPRDAVRIEEMINYFRYDYPPPRGDAPFSVGVEVADCPWSPGHRLARIALKGREVDRGEYRGSNLVVLIDVSGSMRPPNKLPLVKSALALLVEQLDGRDRVALAVYAGSSGLVLPSTSGDAKSEILDALDRLDAGGRTDGGSGLRLAYRIARENFVPGGVNRVILATDGDFNVGVTTKAELLNLIEKDAREGIFLTVLGVGMGNYRDDTLELLADRGNGNYAYLDGLEEARRVLVEQIGGTLVTIAKDVKIQVEFNPLLVGSYRLIGYENRMLRKEEFNDDRRDAGEIGAGHTVTALYEIVPPDRLKSTPSVDPLKYQEPTVPSRAAASGELLTVKLRYKEPEDERSRLLVFPVVDDGLTLESASSDFKFAAAVAMFGMILRDSEHKAEASLDRVLRLSLDGMQPDAGGLRAEFHGLVIRAMEIGDRRPTD